MSNLDLKAELLTGSRPNFPSAYCKNQGEGNKYDVIT